MSEPCSACKDTGKINFGMSTCPKCSGKKKSERATKSESIPSPTGESKSALSDLLGHSPKTTFEIKGRNISPEERESLNQAFGVDTGIEHCFDENSCSCGTDHVNLSAVLPDAIKNLKETNPQLASLVVPLKVDMQTGKLREALEAVKKTFIRVAGEVRRPEATVKVIPAEILSQAIEYIYSAWEEDSVDYPLSDPVLQLQVADTIATTVALVLAGQVKPKECSPGLRFLLGLLGSRGIQVPGGSSISWKGPEDEEN